VGSALLLKQRDTHGWGVLAYRESLLLKQRHEQVIRWVGKKNYKQRRMDRRVGGWLDGWVRGEMAEWTGMNRLVRS